MSSAKTSAVAHNISDFAMRYNLHFSVLVTLLEQQVTVCSMPKYLMSSTLDMNSLDHLHIDCSAEAGVFAVAVCLQETLLCSTESAVVTDRR